MPKGGTIADLLYPRVVPAAWASASARIKAGTGSDCRDLGQCTMSRSMIVKSHHMTEQWVSPLVDNVLTEKIDGGGDGTSVFLTKSCQHIPRILCCQRIWKASSFRKSCCKSVQASKPCRRICSVQVWYKWSFVCSWGRQANRPLVRSLWSGFGHPGQTPPRWNAICGQKPP